jgi:hypothetical protein
MMDDVTGGPEGDAGNEPFPSDEELKEELRRLLAEDELLKDAIENLPDYARELLNRAASGDVSEAEFLREVFVGDCPNCSSVKTVDCDEIVGIEDITIGLCEDCGYIWCLECGVPVERGEICGHWQVCEDCEEEKDEYDECGIPPIECPYILEWMKGTGVLDVEAPGCAWCGEQIGEDAEVFAVGAKIKEGIDFVGDGIAGSPFLPVVIGGRLVSAVVTAADSQAKIDGNDIMFMVCSQECAEALKLELEKEKDIIDRTSLN